MYGDIQFFLKRVREFIQRYNLNSGNLEAALDSYRKYEENNGFAIRNFDIYGLTDNLNVLGLDSNVHLGFIHDYEDDYVTAIIEVTLDNMVVAEGYSRCGIFDFDGWTRIEWDL